VFQDYFPGSFDVTDLPRLASALREIDNRGARFVLSYGSCSEASEFFSEWSASAVSARRSIAARAHHRTCHTELLISNIDVPQGQLWGT